MNERNKGNRLEKFLCDHVVLDLETTSNKIYDAKIIEIAAIKVRAGVIVDRFETLVNPGEHIPHSATLVNNITDEMVKDAPKIEDVIDDFLAFINGEILVGHNITTFDLNVLYDVVKNYNGMDLDNDFIDTLYVARKCNDTLENYKLQTICRHYNIDITNAHRAMKDCCMTEACFKELKRAYDTHGFVKCKKENSISKHSTKKYSDETKALQQLQGFLMGIVADNVLTADEILSLNTWMEENIELKGNYPFDRVYKALNFVLEDGVIEKEELKDLLVLFKQFIAPTEESDVIQITTIVGKHFCLTGEFAYGSRGDVEKMLTDKGGVCDKSVKKTTDYVVVGSQGSENWKQGTYGGKIKKAMEWKEKGSNVQIVSEKTFFDALKQIDDIESIENDSNEDDTVLMVVDVTVEDESWKRDVQKMLDELVISLELPEKALYLAQNIGRVSNKVTSYSICIYEPEYPKIPNRKMDQTRNSVVMNIKEKKDKLDLIIGVGQYENVKYEKELETKSLKSDPKNIHVFMNKNDKELVDYIEIHTKYRIKHYTSKASTFGCCSRFNACSDAKKCVHENRLYSMACSYRAHLDAGRIFYGKNRNID